MLKIEKALQFMRDTAADAAHGYDQENRNGPDYDCSSLVATALNSAGYDVPVTAYTGNLYTYLKQCGFKQINSVTDRKPGDIFLSPGYHVVMCVDANNIVHASINEKGTITGGKQGDQTGKEICERTFYIPSYGWKYHLRAPEEIIPDPVIQGGDNMNCFIKFDGNATVYWYDGIKIRSFSSPQQKAAIEKVYKDSTGRDIPYYKGAAAEKFAQALLDAVNRPGIKKFLD